MGWICQREERLPELFQRDKLLLHSHLMLIPLFITWDDTFWLPVSHGRFTADPRNPIRQIFSTSIKGCILSEKGLGKCHLFFRPITHPLRDVCLINDKATLSSLRANRPLAALGENLLLSFLLHAFATCQFPSWLGQWSLGISCEVGRTSWEGWCAPWQKGVPIWFGKEAEAWGLSEPSLICWVTSGNGS